MPKGESAIGLLKKETYSEQKVELKEGEWLLVYSDGLTEAMNLEGDFFGEKRLEQLLPNIAGLSAPAAGRRLLEAISAFIGTAAPHDDLSMIILRRKGA
jgi:sigma-B regulation protein RsbU (phosphoserine phosphatase)